MLVSLAVGSPASPALPGAVEARLAQRFSPILEMARGDFKPVEVGIFIDGSACATSLLRRSGVDAPEVLSPCATADSLSKYPGQRGLYLDIGAATPNEASGPDERRGTEQDYYNLYAALVRQHKFKT